MFFDDTHADIYAKPIITQLSLALAKDGCDVLSVEDHDESLESFYISLVGEVESMSKLLSAGMTRLFKSRVFHMALLIMTAHPLYLIYLSYKDQIQNPDPYYGMDEALPLILGMLSFVSAVLSATLCGVEYSDGTIRNKIAIGHSRTAIYLSELFLNITACVLLQIVNFTVLFALGNLVIGAFEISFGVIIKMQLLEICVISAYTAIFTLIAVLIQARSTASVLALLSAMSMFFSGISICQRLSPSANAALSNGKQKLYQFLSDFLPSCQAIRIMERGIPDHAAGMVIYDLVILTVTTAAGILVFRRKDLK